MVDSGDVFSSSKAPVEFRSKTLAVAMAAMKYDAINIGDGELDTGMPFFAEAVKKHKLPFVSANISMSGPEYKAVKPYVIKAFKDMKIGITGGTPSSYFKEQSSLEKTVGFKDVNESLRQRVDELKKNKADIVIALLHTGKEAAQNYLEYNDAGGITVAIAGHERYITNEPKKIKGVYLVQNTSEGEYLGVLKLVLDDENRPVEAKLENIALTAKYPDDPDMAALFKDFRKEVPESDSH
ncbi:bifunctional UDP-sugar hydrolase/5'-nucleotidase [Desulforegula conservatrix]|uniref:hypothetical protein n=1 Tax=Desulforegula conservatrix TaxID=153026 RepID=UPI0012EC26FE|nr:hypothetical protein [Desulforegula conservatrix]